MALSCHQLVFLALTSTRLNIGSNLCRVNTVLLCSHGGKFSYVFKAFPHLWYSELKSLIIAKTLCLVKANLVLSGFCNIQIGMPEIKVPGY